MRALLRHRLLGGVAHLDLDVETKMFVDGADVGARESSIPNGYQRSGYLCESLSMAPSGIPIDSRFYLHIDGTALAATVVCVSLRFGT